MKMWIPMLILFLAVTALCVWDGVHTQQVFDKLEKDSSEIYSTLLKTDVENEGIQNKIFSLNEYWTKEMDTLCISISRKDLQPVSDYLQYLCSACINKSQEDAITYSRLLNYNLIGLNQCTGIDMLNLL